MKRIKNIIRYLYVYLWNSFICHLPSYTIRYYILKYCYRARLGNCTIHRNVKFFSPWKLKVGDNTNIQFGSFIDCRGGISIGNNVDITLGVRILSQYHDIQCPNYSTLSKMVIIDDYCVIGSYAVILPGSILNTGTVIGAGSLMNKESEEYSLYCGNPAIFKKKRYSRLTYNPLYKRPFH
ncbi:acyltransferase [Aeromonas caviae]|uniref:acyltransferase n=1 Tax=Aeromonas caviae TaxID=648 RepID=UPI00244870C2|nr:acyltransferase [Aeromonas caviae]MDH1841622.1 acyltransferase [Aeromonas caviae]